LCPALFLSFQEATILASQEKDQGLQSRPLSISNIQVWFWVHINCNKKDWLKKFHTLQPQLIQSHKSDHLSFRFVQGDSPMNDSVDAKIVKLHLLRYTQDEIIAALHPSKTQISRSIRHFRTTGLIPDPSRIGFPSRVISGLASHIEGRTIQEPSISGKSLSGEISGEFGVVPLLASSGSGNASNINQYATTRYWPHVTLKTESRGHSSRSFFRRVVLCP
jgi:hypothetical protein